MPQKPPLFDISQLILARLEFVREARALPPGSERNQKRQIARSLKRLIGSQAQDSPRPSPVRRKRLRHKSSLNDRLIQMAQSLRLQASAMPAGIQQEHLLQKALQADEAVRLNENLSTAGRQPQVK
jgi:hypothetical protein